MAKTAVMKQEKIVSVKICTKCKQKIIPFSIILNGKRKMAKNCDCGLFLNGEKLQ